MKKIKIFNKITFAGLFVILAVGFVNVPKSHAAYLNITGFETGDASEVYLSTPGTYSMQSSIKRTGSYALRTNPTNGNSKVWFRGPSTSSSFSNFNGSGTNSAYSTIYFYAAANPSAQSAVVSYYVNGPEVSIDMNTSGQLCLYYTNVSDVKTLLGSCSSAITLGAWHKLEFKAAATNTAGGASVEFKLDSSVVASGTSLTIGSVPGSQILFMVLGPTAGITHPYTTTTADFYYDDIAVSNSAYPGVGQVKILKPNAAGTWTNWTNGAGTSPTNIANVPHDSDTSYITTSSTFVSGQRSANLDDASTGGVVGTIGTVKVGAIVRDEGGVSALSLQSTVNAYGSQAGATSGDPGSTYAYVSAIYDTTPGGGQAWTSTLLDSLQVGIQNENAVLVRATAIYAMVWSDGNTAPTITVQPSATPGGGKTRIGPSNSWTLGFTATDAQQTGAGELSYTLKTNGTNLTVGGPYSFTSGSGYAGGFSYNEPNLVAGTNTLYVAVSDGTFTTNSNTFTVLRDDVAPTAATSISTNPGTVTSTNYTVTFTPNDAVSTNADEISYKICAANDACATPVTGGTGTSTSGASKTTGTLTDAALVNGANTRWVRTCDGANNCTNTSFTVTADFKPTVTTSAASSLTTSSAILNSTVNPNGAATNVSYLWGTTAGVACNLQPNTLAGPTGLTGTANLSGATTQATLPSLSANTTYYFCAMATNAYGTNYGTVTSLQTSATPGAYTMMDAGSSLGSPDCNDATMGPCPVTVMSATGVTTTTISVSWSAPSGVGPAPTSYKITCVSGGACNNTDLGTQTSPYTHSGVTCATTYTYTMSSVNASGTTVSDTFTGSTSCVSAPTLASATATSITPTTATLGGNVTANGGAALNARGTCWSTADTTPQIGDAGVTCAAEGGTATGVFTHARTGITSNPPTIYYSAYATNTSSLTGYVFSSFTQPAKYANGTACTTGSDCSSGNCYVDADGDRYAPASGSSTCKASSQLVGTDCLDSGTCPGGGAASTCWQNLDSYTDADNDTQGYVASSTSSVNYAGTVVNDSSAGTNAWNSPSNATTSNDQRADVTTPGSYGYSNYLKATNFGFSLPSTALIRGIKVEIEARAASGFNAQLVAKIVKGGVIQPYGIGIGTYNVTEVFLSNANSSTETWDTVLTYSDINSSTFGVAFQAWSTNIGGDAVYVDSVRITVYYAVPSGATPICSGASRPAGYSANVNDCYDSNANVKLGQTSYFPTHRGDGRYNYDCDGADQNTYGTLNFFIYDTCGGTNPRVPACGSTTTEYVAGADRYNDRCCSPTCGGSIITTPACR